MLDLKNLEFFFPLTFFSFIIVSCYLFITTGNNPGYFNLDNAENSDTSIITINKNNENNHINSTINKDEELNKHDQYTITQQNIDENLNDPFKFCNKCKIEKFLRMRHCEKCERCVHKFDHHCFWIGACVGELNHARFWIFLFFQTIVNLMGFVIVDFFN